MKLPGHERGWFLSLDDGFHVRIDLIQILAVLTEEVMAIAFAMKSNGPTQRFESLDHGERSSRLEEGKSTDNRASIDNGPIRTC